MSEEKSDHNNDRIDKLEDSRIEEIKETVTRIEKILVGNGSEGLISKVDANSMRSKGVVWGLGVIYTAIIGGLIKYFSG